MSRKNVQSIIGVSALLVAMAGCGSSKVSVPPIHAREFVYATSFTFSGGTANVGLNSFSLDTGTGALSATSSSALSGFAVGVAVDPNGKYLYASQPNPALTNVIDVFSISPGTGAPKQTGYLLLNSICSFCQPPSGPGALALAPGGKALYYGSSSAGGGFVQGIGALTVSQTDGSLSVVLGSPFAADQVPTGILVHPSGKFVYTANTSATGLGLGPLVSVSGFAVDPSTGALTPVAGSPFPITGNPGYAGFAIHPSGKFLYAPPGFGGSGILAWSIDPTSGALAALAGAPFTPGIAAEGGAFDSTGTRFYVSGGHAGGIAGFIVDGASGALTLMAGSPFLSGSSLETPAVDPTDGFLLAGDFTNKAVAAYKLDASGVPAAVGSPVPINATPLSLSIVSAP